MNDFVAPNDKDVMIKALEHIVEQLKDDKVVKLEIEAKVDINTFDFDVPESTTTYTIKTKHFKEKE